ncbi:MAG: serine protease, partial [Nitrosarchaeum sp.]|nr:serine protease [Nitrosarchaeum sp.]
MIIPNNYKWILKNKTILCISLGFVLMAGFIPMLSFSEMKATPSNSTSVSAVTSFSDDVETIVSSDTSTKPKKDTPLDAKRKIKFDEGFYDQIQEKIKTKNEFHQCLDEIGNFSNDEIFVYDSNSTTYENSKIVNKYEKIKDKPKCQKLLIAEENEPNKTIGNLIDKTDYHHVIIAVSKQDGTDRNPKIISQENKEDLEEVLRHTHGAKDIYVAERLSFISARIPTSEIPKIADHGNIVFRAGDGEQKVFQSATTIEQAKHIIHSDSVGTLPPFPFRGHGVTVSVIDNPGILNTTGLVNPTPTVSSHPDLPYGLDQTVIEVTSCSNGVCTNAITRESGSHSIGIASIIAGQGIVANAGVAPSAKLLDVAISQNQGITDPVHTTATVGNFVNAFDWSIRNGADLANISISPLTGCHEYNTFGILIDEAIDEGMLIITSVGNISSVRATVDDIACPYNNIAVGSVDANSIIAYDSLHGPAIYNQVQPDRRLKPELVAPGVDIFMADENDEYSTGSGTSFAAPFVTAAAALIKDSAAAPYYTPLETKVTLLLGAKWDPQGLIPFLRYPITAEGYEALGNTNPTDVVYTTLNSYGFGLLNVEKSLTYAKIKDEIEDGQFSLNHIIRDTIHQDETKPYTFYVSTADVGKETKIILSWFSQPMTDVFAPYPSIVPTPISNLNLQIYSPASTITPIISSNSLYQNNEFIVFKPTVQGLYTVKVIGTFVDIAQINEERFVIGSTIPFNIPPSNNSPTIYQFDSDIAVDYIGSGFNEVHIWLTGDDTNNDILSFFTVFEPTHGKLSPPLKQDRNSARVIYQPGPTFTGSDFFSFSAFDGKTFVNGPGTPVDLKAENIIPTSTQQDGLSSPPGIIDTGSAKFFRTEIKQTILSFPQPGQISALYVISDVPATLSFETTGTSYVSLSANSGKLIDFTNSQGITPTNIKIAAQNTVDANSVWIGYDTDTEDSPSPPNVTIGDTIVHTGPHDNYAILTITRSNNNNAMSVD